MKIGMEIERLPLDKKGFMVKYDNPEKKGIKQLLEEISSACEWGKLYNNQVLIGLKKGNTTITLEPGCQFELSLEPKKNVIDLKKEYENINNMVSKIKDDYNKLQEKRALKECKNKYELLLDLF